MIALKTREHRRSPKSAASQAWQSEFMKLLPAILRHVRLNSRGLHPEAREELQQEVVCNCLVAYQRLWGLGKADLAYPTVLASYALKQVRSGRRVGSRQNCRDVSSKHAQRYHGFVMERLDRIDPTKDDWEQLVVEDRRASPSEVATLRIDFREWLSLLPARRRQIAELLATGESTERVARRFGVSSGRISQLRRELETQWATYHGETTTAT